jgi:predicted kinase
VRECSGMSPEAAPSAEEDNLADMVIVICGPIASGKSTVARELAQLFERQGLRAAAIDLDLVYEMLQTDGSAKTSPAAWRRARRAAAGLTDVLLREGVGVVIAEGDFLTSDERAEYVDALASVDEPLFVTLKMSVDTALERVHGDASRGLSRDPDFLRRHYEQLDGAMRARPETDLVIDASSIRIEDAARTIKHWASPGT